jgi:hypothetical protein
MVLWAVSYKEAQRGNEGRGRKRSRKPRGTRREQSRPSNTGRRRTQRRQQKPQYGLVQSYSQAVTIDKGTEFKHIQEQRRKESTLTQKQPKKPTQHEARRRRKCHSQQTGTAQTSKLSIKVALAPGNTCRHEAASNSAAERYT